MLVNILQSVKDWANETFLKLTGGTLTGNLAIRASNVDRPVTPSANAYSDAKLRLEGSSGTALAEIDTAKFTNSNVVSRWIAYNQVGDSGGYYSVVQHVKPATAANNDGYIDSQADIYLNHKKIYWKEYGYGDKFAITPYFNGADDANLLKIQSAVGAAGTDPALTDRVTISGKTGNVNISGGVRALGSFDTNGVLYCRWTNMGYNTAPSATIYNGSVQVTDKNGQLIGHVEYSQQTNRTIGHNFAAVRQYNGSAWAWYQCAMYVSSAGAVTYSIHTPANFRSAIGAAASSDRRLKHDITPLGEDAVQFVKDLEPCVYTINGERQVGFIAQDIAGSDPWGTRMAFETEEGLDGLDDWEKMPDGSSTWKLDYIRTIPPIAAALKKAMERIDQLEARVAELENGANNA